MSAKPRAVWSMKPHERLELAHRHMGREVEVRYSTLRDRNSAESVPGQVVAVATSTLGGGSDFIVLRRPRVYDLAISLASVVSIEEA